jgi:hypothetical protein
MTSTEEPTPIINNSKEPLPESTQEDVPEKQSEFGSYDDMMKEKQENTKIILKKIKRNDILDKEMAKIHNKNAKIIKQKNKKQNKDVNKKPSGFETPNIIPENFYIFLKNGLENKKFSEPFIKTLEGVNITTEMMIPRSYITSFAWDYIKTNNLYDEKNKRILYPDVNIRNLFSMKEEEQLGFFSFQTYVSRLFPNKNDENNEKIINEDYNSDDINIDESNEDIINEVVVNDDEQTQVKQKNKTKNKNLKSSTV